MTKSILAGDSRDVDVLEALGKLDLPHTGFWHDLGLAGRDDIVFRTVHGNRDALMFEKDRFQGLANLYLFLALGDDEGEKVDEVPLILPVRYEGRIIKDEGPAFERIALRKKMDWDNLLL